MTHEHREVPVTEIPGPSTPPDVSARRGEHG